jgi:hypothetical protein
MGIEHIQRPLSLLACRLPRRSAPTDVPRSAVRWKAINKIRLKMSVELLPS